MEDIQELLKLEETNLNQLSPTELVEHFSKLKDWYKSLQSNGEKWVQSLMKDYDELINAVAKAWTDWDYFIELAKSNPKMADKVAKYHWHKSVDDALKIIGWVEKKWDEDEEDVLLAKLEERKSLKEANEIKSKFIEDNLSTVSEENKSKWLEAYKEFADWRKETKEIVNKAIKYANNEVFGWDIKKYQSIVNNINWIWLGKWAGGNTQSKSYKETILWKKEKWGFFNI